MPDSGECGDDGGRWVKFTTGGPVLASGTANSGSPNWSAEYEASEGSFKVFDVVDQFGNLIFFEAVVGGSSSANPVWTFDLTNDSPRLEVPNDANFSQFAICALPPLVTATITKTVNGDGDSTQSFLIHVDCRLGEGETNLATPSVVSLVDGQSASITAPAGAACTVSEPVLPTGYALVSITPAAFTMPTPTRDVPQPVVLVAVINEVTEQLLTISKTSVGGTGIFTFDVSCTDTAGVVVFSQDGVQIAIDEAGATSDIDLTVPGRSSCTVTEVNIPAGFEPDENPIVVDAGGTASFTNTGYGSLRITKTQVGGLAGTLFSIRYDCTDGTTGSVSLANGGSQTIPRILGGARAPSPRLPLVTPSPSLLARRGSSPVERPKSRSPTRETPCR
ncbi:DUF5979 domain-containing protein [Nocardioides piscis]|uniref:DUF5979 domain-containing protein n=1 Tax=Nocardioides piscis TaxID=2714938 RepID=A0A6G7YEZ8_9ACTN|nr:DUF5979 domain-containing protein [Nocardioides piscis]QIK75187.1 hypothetical protein G7071_06885 [Nocardioides piscis]